MRALFRIKVLTLTAGVAAVAGLLAIAKPGWNAEPWRLDFYRSRVTAGAQCRYADGTKAILLRTQDPRRMALVMPGWSEPVVPLNVDAQGAVHFEANGGVATYHSIDLAIEDLTNRPLAPVTTKTLDAFLAATDVPPCNRPRFAADLRGAY